MVTLLSILLFVTQILHPDVRTLTCHYADDPTPQRVWLTMGSDQALEISFDIMSHDIQQLCYSVYHLDKNGERDDLASVEYLRGFTTTDITDYETSFNTRRDYTHYRFRFPDEGVQITRSGRYAIVVHPAGEQERPILCQVVDVVEPMVKLSAEVRANTDIEIAGRYQQLEVVASGLRGANLTDEYCIDVTQNNRPDTRVLAPKPTYVESSVLRWQNCRALIFEGGHEFRHIDLYSRLMPGTNVDRIGFDGDDYHAQLMLTPCRKNEQYIHDFDANGQFVVNAERTTDADVEAEYIWTHFVLPMDEPVLGEVFVGGEWNQNRMDIRSRMSYDTELRCYYLSTMLKQGGYDFQYWVSERRNKATLLYTEGSHWQTKNEYEIRVWYRPIGSRYDQLVGLLILQ